MDKLSQPTKAAAPERRLVGLDEVAAYLGVSKLTVRRLIAAGRIPAYRLGYRTVRVDLNEVNDLLLQPIPAAADALLAGRGGAQS